MGIFSGVAYTLSSSLRASDQKSLSELLDANGATRGPVEDATHIISDTLEFEGWQSASENAEVVTPTWVLRSIALGKRQMTKYYPSDPSMLFSGVCACATDIEPSDVEVLSGAIVALGGQWRQGLTREVTHLFAMGTTSDKYQTAFHYQEQTRVKVLVPHWFDDVVRLGIATIPTLQYEWPDPKVLQLAPPSPKGKRTHKPPAEKLSLYKSVVLGNSEDEIPENLGRAAERVDVWKGKRILLSVSLGLNPGRREAVVAGVKRFGGIVIDVKSASNETNKVDDADILITKFRAGGAYFKALKRTGVIIGNLCWLFHVQTIRAVSPPTDQLLHYPVPSKQIEGFDKHEITVTNYTGEAREYLKRLIQVMGASFTPNMSPRNTVVIAAYKSGTKTDRAAQWSIPVVNHTWLEDCFVNWRNLSVGHEKYVRFSPACDCSGFLGDKGIGRKVILDDAEQDVPTQDFAVPTGSIKEVEEAIAVNDNDVGTGSQPPRVKEEGEDVEMVDDDAPDVGVDMEVDVPSKLNRTASPSPTPQKRRRSGNAEPSVPNSRTPNRPTLTRRRTQSQVEVVVPPQPDYTSPRKDAISPPKIGKPASHKLVASESSTSAKKPSPVKVKTPARKSVTTVQEEEELASEKRPSPKKPQKRKRDESEPEEENERSERPIPGPSKPKPTQSTRAVQRRVQESSPPPAGLGEIPLRGRRSAAQKADEKLKDIMPDVINFEKQMKRGNVVSEWEKTEKERERAEKKAKEKEKSKENTVEKAKNRAQKRRRSDVSAKDEEDEEEEEGDDEPPTSKPAGSNVHIMTTKVQVSEDTKKALMKLGAKFTEKPLECTHLIAGAFGRTEKLLSSIAVAPFILRGEWLTKSAAKGRFLPEKDYSLEDRESEAKYAFKMTKTLERAKKNKGKLLEGKTFYLTQKVDVDKKLMKNVVTAHGGTLVFQTPTYRMVTSKPDRYVISCEDDASIWRTIAENDVSIYTKELILTGILKQEIAWDDHEFMVPGSY